TANTTPWLATINQGGNSATVTASNALKVDGSAVTQPVSYATTGSGNATGALRVEIANNGTGLVGLNAGTNAIGKLAANSGVDIGDVDVTSVIPGTAATNLGKAEDVAAVTGDTGVAVYAIQQSTPADTAADGDYSAMQMVDGALAVQAMP